jgi:3-phosphoshikimate 1-carboxyvinyltransferase
MAARTIETSAASSARVTTTVRVSRPERLRTKVRVPGDKSISHRSLILNAIADGDAVVERILDSDDVRSTAACLRALGVAIDWPEASDRALVYGRGLRGLCESADVLDCGNSGTTMRLMSGLLAGQPFLSILSGDDSLRTRPMGRVITPLQQMGAHLHGRKSDTLAPLVIRGGGLHGTRYESPVASAQVKSAVLLAGLYADGPVIVTEPEASRDHTERMLAAMGCHIETAAHAVRIEQPSRLSPLPIRVPGDISSAAPWLVLGACHPDAEIVIENVNVNPTRTGLLDILDAMGASVDISEPRMAGGEPVADLVVRTSDLRATRVDGGVVPRAIDELPLVAILGCFAQGDTVIAGAAELRVKESDRVEAVVRVLGSMGANITPRDDGFVVHGPCRLTGATVDAGGDHRVGMLAAIAGALATDTTEVVHDAVGVSYPRFWDDLRDASLGGVAAR